MARLLVSAIVLLALCPSIVRSAEEEDILARIKKVGIVTPFQGKARWLKSSKLYKIRIKAGNTETEMAIPGDEVESVEAVKPKELDAAAKMVQAGQHAAAIPVLEKIADRYFMFQWDVEATRWLAEAYMGTGNKSKALTAVRDLEKANPSALLAGGFFKVYCTVLLENNLMADLNKAIDAQIAMSESRESQAVAQLMRGDIQMKKGNYKDALLEGYLRTVVFYQNIKQIQPEAMYKAMLCFKELGDTGKADKMRKKLMAEYPTSPEAQKAQNG